MKTRQPSARRRLVKVRAVALVAIVLTACSTSAPRQTGFQQSVGTDVSSREIRIRAVEYATTFAHTLEIAADSILRLASDRTVARNALIWKSYGVAAVFRSATLPDPLMAWIDSRVLTYQMLDYFTTGLGRELFGSQQALAVEAARFIENEMYRVRDLAVGEVDPDTEKEIRQFATANPLTNPYFFRPSPVEQLARFLGEGQVAGLRAAGSMAELMEDMSQRLNMYAEMLPRTGRWQAELMMADLADPERAAAFGEILNRIEAMETLNAFLLDTPDLLDEQREILLEEVDRQRVAFERALDAYVAKATGEILAGLTPEREAALAGLERILQAEIDAAVTRLDGSISQAVVDIDGALMRAVDRLFTRLLQLAAIVGVVVVLVGVLLRRRLASAEAE